MSRAFTKESDHDVETFPERAISSHPNLVTATGMALLESRVKELEAERSAARTTGDVAALARIARDLRYFHAQGAVDFVVRALRWVEVLCEIGRAHV